MSKAQSTETTETTETKKRTASKESILKMNLRHVRKDLEKATARWLEFKAIQTEMDGHKRKVEGLNAREASLKADLIKELGLG